MKANLDQVINRKNELNLGYNQYVENSPQQTDNGWALIEARYLHDNPLTSPQALRVPFPVYGHLLSAGQQDPNSYVKANGIPPDKDLVSASTGQGALPQVGQNGYQGGPGMIVNRQQPLDAATVAAGVARIGGYTFKVLSPTQMVLVGTPAANAP